MKKFILSMAVALLGVVSVSAMSRSNIRENARFLSDRMAYELDLTPQQYDDCYEINYDFIASINSYMDDVCRGYNSAIDQYYTYLDYRNEDLRYVLTESQYRTFLTLEYFYRPIYTYLGKWQFRIYQIYSNRNFFYFDAPSIFKSYRGGHDRSHFSGGFYGQNKRYSHKTYSQPAPLRNNKNQPQNRRNDFGQNRQDQGSTRPNDYKNQNQKNREQDTRYTNDRQNNQNSPMINRRDQQQGNQQGAQQQNQGNNRGQQPSTGNQGNNRSQQQGNNQSSNGSTRNGNTRSQGNSNSQQSGVRGGRR